MRGTRFVACSLPGRADRMGKGRKKGNSNGEKKDTREEITDQGVVPEFTSDQDEQLKI